MTKVANQGKGTILSDTEKRRKNSLSTKTGIKKSLWIFGVLNPP